MTAGRGHASTVGIVTWQIGQLSLVSGPMPAVLAGLGVLALLWLLIRRDRRHLTRTAPAIALACVVLTGIFSYVVEVVWRPFPDPLPLAIYLALGAGLLGLLAVVPRLRHAHTWTTRLGGVLAVVVVLVSATAQVNYFFRAYPTVAAALGQAPADQIPFDAVRPPDPAAVVGAPLSAVWRPPSSMAARGQLTRVVIPGTASGFAARPARVYLPPAYAAAPRALLPVLVLMAGQPSTPDDWIAFGRIGAAMDAYAAAHLGLAPIVVMPDGTGSVLANPLCLDSRLGNVNTYLARDVPAWVKANLQVDPNPQRWAVAGSSYGGTCSLQLAVNNPDVYPTFLDISGQSEPSLGNRERTIAGAFGGDGARFAAVNPLDLMQRNRYPQLTGTFVVGASDNQYRPQAQQVFDAAQAAGMTARLVEVPGGHDWGVWRQGLVVNLDWLGTRLGLTP